MAIPSSDLPGHKKVHDLTITALDTCQETRSVDFKESSAWENIKIKIIKTAMAMGNLRDGGLIIIGVSERDDTWDLTGISESDLSTYDLDSILDTMNRYTSPPLNVDIVTVKHSDDKVYLVIYIYEFDDKPFVCKRNGPNNEIKEGDIYIRPLGGRPRTTKIQSADDLHDLLELAADKKSKLFIERAKRLGLITEVTGTDHTDETSTKKYDEELEGL